jgi:AraC-like DNA-binding protein
MTKRSPAAGSSEGERIGPLTLAPASPTQSKVSNPEEQPRMSTTADQTTVRRISPSLELHARVASRGRWAHVIGIGREDLLLAVGSETTRLSCRRRVHTLPPTLVTTAGLGDVVVLELAGPAQCRAVYVPSGVLARAADLPVDPRDDQAAERRVVWVIARPGICELVDRVTGVDELCQLLEDSQSFSRRMRVAVREPVPHPVVWRARDHLLRAFARKVTLDELASVVGMRRFALAHAFTREVGMPPHAYQTHVRVQRARELIGAGRLLSTVSVEVGFADQSHLTRHFKRVLGLTPGRYARAVAAQLEHASWSPSVSTLTTGTPPVSAPAASVRGPASPFSRSEVTFVGPTRRQDRLVVSWGGRHS